jgi:NAD(P)-dependent dehydrogenase (short-subunit alcohol dehydrogenase family)
MERTDLSGRTALVTAASRGIGWATALELARCGADVVLGVRRLDESAGRLAELEVLGGRPSAVQLDATDLDQSRRAIDEAVDRHGSLDILVNNAGGSIVGDALSVTEEDFDAVWSLNTRSTFFLSQYAARHMAERGSGSIVNVASQAGLVALPGESSYCTAKAAVIHLTRCLAVEWGSVGIRVNAVAPTFVATDGTREALADKEFYRDTIDRIAALHRIGHPEEVASAIAFLASDAASLITGHTLVADGGWTAR